MTEPAEHPTIERTPKAVEMDDVPGYYDVVPVDWIRPYPQNAKIHTKEQVQKIAESIKSHGGWNTRISVDSTGEIIAGHGRRLAAIALEQEFVPIHVRDDLDAKQVRSLRLADNKVAEGEMDTNVLEVELRELAGLEVDMSSFYSEKELSFMLEDPGEIDLGAISENISGEVQEHTAETESNIGKVDEERIPLFKLFKAKDLSIDEHRDLSMLLIHAETMTGKEGLDALRVYGLQIMDEGVTEEISQS